MLLQISKTKWAIFFAFISMFVLGISDNIRGPLYPELLNFFSLSHSQGALSFALTSLAAFMANTLAAFSLKKIQLDRLMFVSIILMIIGPLLMGLASTFSFYLAGAIFFGFSIGSLGVVQNLLIAENTHGRSQTQALSGLHGVYGLSSLVAPLLASRAPAWFLNNFPQWTLLTKWQSSFFIITVLAAAILLMLFFTTAQPQFTPHALHDESVHGKKCSVWTMLWFAGFFASYVGAEILISSRLALYMRTYFEMSLEKSSDYVFYFFIFLFLGRIFFVFKSFKMQLKNQLNLFLGSSLVCLLLGLWLHPFFLTLVGLTMAPFYPMAIGYISATAGFQKRRFLTFTMGVQSLFVIFMHIVVGYITDAYGLFYAFGIGIFLLIGSMICLNLHPKINT